MPLAVLKPSAELAPRVVLTGDPGRALRLAQTLTDKPMMFNHARGLWGYTGIAADGEPLTVQASGVGGPSAASVLSDLAELGARVVVRAGTCRAVDPGLAPEGLVAVSAAIAGDGTSRALGATGTVEPDSGLTAALAGAVAHRGVCLSTDLWTHEDTGTDPARVRDLSTAAVLQLARLRGIRAGAVLLVGEATEAAVDALGAVAAGALLAEAAACR